MFKRLILSTFIFVGTSANCGLPPASSKGDGETVYKTTFKTNYDTIPVTRSGTTVTIGTIPISKGGTGSTSQNFVDLTTGQTIAGLKQFSDSVGIGGAANANAVLDVQSTTKAFLPPRVTTVQKNAIPSPVEGMTVYDSDLNALQFYDGTSWVSNPVSFANYVKTPNLTLPKMGSAKISAGGVALVDNGDMMLGNCSLPGPTGRFACNFETGFFTSNPVCTATQFNNSGGTIIPVAFIETLSNTAIEVRTVTSGSYSFDAFFLICHGE